MNEPNTYHLEELIAQPYPNCKFSAGRVEGHEVDTIYVEVERGGVRTNLLLLRPDEAAALVYCLGGALWSNLLAQLPEEEV